MTEGRSGVTCECTPVVETSYGDEPGRSPSVAAVEAVAAVEGTPPTEVGSLFDAVDPDAMDRLLASDREGSTGGTVVAFSVDGWNVFVRDDGLVRVCDPDRVTDPAPAFEKSIGD